MHRLVFHYCGAGALLSLPRRSSAHSQNRQQRTDDSISSASTRLLLPFLCFTAPIAVALSFSVHAGAPLSRRRVRMIDRRAFVRLPLNETCDQIGTKGDENKRGRKGAGMHHSAVFCLHNSLCEASFPRPCASQPYTPSRLESVLRLLACFLARLAGDDTRLRAAPLHRMKCCAVSKCPSPLSLLSVSLSLSLRHM